MLNAKQNSRRRKYTTKKTPHSRHEAHYAQRKMYDIRHIGQDARDATGDRERRIDNRFQKTVDGRKSKGEKRKTKYDRPKMIDLK